MSYAQRHTVTLTTDASGDAIGYTDVLTGKLSAIHYVKDDFADGVDFTITSDVTGQSLWTDTDVNASEIVAPRQPTHTTAGAAALYASGGVAVLDKIALSNDRVKIVVGSGGDTKTGTFYVVLE